MPTHADSFEDRAKSAAKIIKSPANYKICQGCDSIVLMKAHTCPNCASYRFEESMAAVIRQARLLARRERRSVVPADLE
ncbi:MAG: hypothetical protein EOP86_05675 [Verrucomicrobiaceae bacterium]|nr:MAG: hypothetical protein EOP86_05675 [Verrucomicrobiaceae bacterium]